VANGIAEQVKEAIVTEKLRRKANPNGDVPMLQWALAHFGVGGDREALDDTQRKVRHFCYKYSTGKSEKNNPNALVYGRTYPAWPVEGYIPAWVTAQMVAGQEVWNAVALHFQHELSVIRDAYARVAADSSLDDTAKSQARKAVDFSRVNRLKRDLKPVFDTAIAIRKGSVTGTEFEKWLASRLGVEQLRSVQARLTRVVSTSRKGKAWDQGYPRPSRTADNWSLDLYFDGQNLELGHWQPQTEAKTLKVAVSKQCDPPDHHGRRTGSRAVRQMRRFTFNVPTDGIYRRQGVDSFTLNVLVHDPDRLPSRIKGARLVFRDGKWSVSLLCEDTEFKPVTPATRRFLGVDIGWRQKEHGAVAVVHYATTEVGSYIAKPILLPLNRKARRWCKGPSKSMLPYGTSDTVRENLREFQQEIAERQKAMKAALTTYLESESRVPAGWQKAGKTALRHADVRDEQIATQLVRWLLWDSTAVEKFSYISAAVTARKEKAYYKWAHEICGMATDIGVEAKFVKKLAEKKLTKAEKAERMKIVANGKAAYSPEKHIEEAAAYNRQFAAPARFIEILNWVAKKRGVRIHVIDPWMTTRRCLHCGTDNPPLPLEAETYVCVGCEREIRHDENAAMQLARLARECASDDGDSALCSRDKPHGLSGRPAQRSVRKDDNDGPHSPDM